MANSGVGCIGDSVGGRAKWGSISGLFCVWVIGILVVILKQLLTFQKLWMAVILL